MISMGKHVIWFSFIYFCLFFLVFSLRNRVVTKTETVVLSCVAMDVAPLPSSFSVSSSSSSSSSPTSSASLSSASPSWLVWNFYPMNDTRSSRLSDCKRISPLYNKTIHLMKFGKSDQFCHLTNKENQIMPPGTYSCIKLEYNIEMPYEADIVLLESDPECDLTIQIDGKDEAIPVDGINPNITISRGDNDQITMATNSTSTNQVITVANSTEAKVHCRLSFSGRLLPKFEVFVDHRRLTPRNQSDGWNSQKKQEFQRWFGFEIAFKESSLIMLTVEARFEAPKTVSTMYERVTNSPDFRFVRFLALQMRNQVHFVTTSPNVYEGEVKGVNNKDVKNDLVTIMVITFGAILFLTVFAFCVFYFQTKKKIADIQNNNRSVNEASVPPGLRADRVTTLYEEINPEDELSDFHQHSTGGNFNQYIHLDREKGSMEESFYSTLDKKRSHFKGDDLGKRSEYLSAKVPNVNVYLDVNSSISDPGSPRRMSIPRVVKGTGEMAKGKEKTVNFYLELLGSTPKPQQTVSFPLDSTYLHLLNDPSNHNNAADAYYSNVRIPTPSTSLNNYTVDPNIESDRKGNTTSDDNN